MFKNIKICSCKLGYSTPFPFKDISKKKMDLFIEENNILVKSKKVTSKNMTVKEVRGVKIVR